MRQFQKILHELKDVVANHEPGEPLRPPPSLPFIELEGRRLSYAPMGLDNSVDAAPPVVLIHGFGGFFMDWPRVMAPLARHTRVYAIDLPGWGFSDANPRATSMEDDVAAVKSFLDALDLKNVVLCGISYGAGITWAAAVERLQRVQRAVLLNPMPPFPLKHMGSPLYRGIFFLNANRHIAYWGNRFLPRSHYEMICKETLLNFRLLDPFYLELGYLAIRQPKVWGIMHKQAVGAREVDWAAWEHKLAGIRMPVDILHAKEDRIFPMAAARHLHRLIPSSRLIQVDRCGHAMVFDQHRRVADHLISCLDKSESRIREAK